MPKINLCGGCPDERARFLVPAGQPLVEGTLQFSDASGGSAPIHARRGQCKPTLHLIEPGAADGGEVQMELAALVGLEPAPDNRFWGCGE